MRGKCTDRHNTEGEWSKKEEEEVGGGGSESIKMTLDTIRPRAQRTRPNRNTKLNRI